MRRKILIHSVPARRNLPLVVAMLLLSCGLISAQVVNGSGLPPLPTTEQIINRNTDNFAGSIPQGKATAETIDLTIGRCLGSRA